MLATRRWMMVIPRVQETCDLGGERLQVSATWFAGNAFATRPEQIPLIEQAGPMRLLASVTTA
jgi:ATP adenylyltransferase/5',5'''-P-1,P-4-tetraphosphate phosphorylase II